MIVFKEVCVGCGRCQPYCPAGAIYFEDRQSVVDQEIVWNAVPACAARSVRLMRSVNLPRL